MRKPKSKALYVSAAVFALLGGSAATAEAAYKTVTVQDNGQRKVLRGFTFGNLGSFLEDQKVNLSQRDRVSPSLSSSVKNGMDIVIDSPNQVQLIDGNASVQVESFAETVGDLMKEQGIQLGQLDQVDVPLTSKIQDGEVIHIRRVHESVSSKTQDIPFQTIRQSTDNLYVGQHRVLTHGVKGLQETKTTSVYVNGHRVGQTLTTTVVRKPVNQVIEVGTKHRPQVLASRGNESLLVTRQLTVLATAYASGGRTATGWSAQPGVIAVDPRVIPLGTKLYIPGIGVVRAEDTGGGIVGNRIDICMGSESAAENWGSRTITVYVLQ